LCICYCIATNFFFFYSGNDNGGHSGSFVRLLNLRRAFYIDIHCVYRFSNLRGPGVSNPNVQINPRSTPILIKA